MNLKNNFFVLLVLLIAISCGKDKTTSEELVGDWVYERETFNSFSSFDDLDVTGFITFRADETGDWVPSAAVLDFHLEWDLQSMDQKISLTKDFVGTTADFPFTRIYDLTRTNEDNFTLTFHRKFESLNDTIPDFEQFENIILTRI